MSTKGRYNLLPAGMESDDVTDVNRCLKECETIIDDIFFRRTKMGSQKI